jgi:hypothetical protein
MAVLATVDSMNSRRVTFRGMGAVYMNRTAWEAS